ncbi:MAG: hypothetical protein L0Y39_10880 [Methylococcaceae bacterium]|nr:hypothetical protein [Methylococcaceae bacterium]
MPITSIVDEAILLADRVFLMSNGPNARIAESVIIQIPRPRRRREIIKSYRYYKIRNYLVDFLISGTNQPDRAKTDHGFPLEVDPVAQYRIGPEVNKNNLITLIKT